MVYLRVCCTYHLGRFHAINIKCSLGAKTTFFSLAWNLYMDRVKRIWYLSRMRAAKVQASLRIRAPLLLAHTISESRGTFRQKAISLAALNGWTCAVKFFHDGMLEDTNSLDGAHIVIFIFFSADTDNKTRRGKRWILKQSIFNRLLLHNIPHTFIYFLRFASGYKIIILSSKLYKLTNKKLTSYISLKSGVQNAWSNNLKQN